MLERIVIFRSTTAKLVVITIIVFASQLVCVPTILTIYLTVVVTTICGKTISFLIFGKPERVVTITAFSNTFKFPALQTGVVAIISMALCT